MKSAGIVAGVALSIASLSARLNLHGKVAITCLNISQSSSAHTTSL